MKNKIDKFLEILMNLDKPHKSYVIITNIIIAFLVYLLVYFTGGIKYVYSHTMYIPIIIVGITLGWKWGLIFGLLGGLLMGPFMPLVIETGEKQALFNWIYRLLIFTIVGLISGVGSNTLRGYISALTKVTNHHYITNIPNINSLRNEKIITKERTVVSVLVNNYDINFCGDFS